MEGRPTIQSSATSDASCDLCAATICEVLFIRATKYNITIKKSTRSRRNKPVAILLLVVGNYSGLPPLTSRVCDKALGSNLGGD